MSNRQPSSFGFRMRLQLPLVIRVSAILILIAGVILSALFALRGCSFGTETVTKGGKPVEGASREDTFLPFGEDLLIFDGKTLSCLSRDAQVLWQYQTQDEGSWSVATSQRRVALYCGTRLVLLNEKGEADFSGSMEGSVSCVRCGLNSFAVELDSAQSLVVLDRNGVQTDTIDLSAGELVDFDFYSGNDLLWVLSINVSGLSPVSRLDIYKPGKELVSSYKSDEQLYYKPLFYQDDIYLLGTETMDLATSKTAESYSVFGWQYSGSAQLADGLSVLFTLAGENQPSVVRVFHGGAFTDLHVPSDSLSMFPGQNGVYVADGRTLQLLPYKIGAAKVYAFRYPVTDVLCCFSDCMAVAAEDSVYIVRLP